MLSQTAEYALRAVVYLAQIGKPQTAREIAQVTHVPSGYLSKILQELSRAGALISQRGLGGGFALPGDPKDISLYSIVNVVDPIKRIDHCPLDSPDHQVEICALHRRLDDAAATVEASFRETMLADLLLEKPIFTVETNEESENQENP
jgi:Rrf2 family protein